MSAKSKTQIREKRELLEKESLSDSWHSRAYHRDFDGWVEVPELDDKGRTRIRRIYTGAYYKAALTDKAWKLRRVWYILLILASAALFGLSAMRGTAANTVRWAVLPQVVSVFCYIFLLWFWVLRLFVPRIMTKGQRRECARNLRLAALIGSIALSLSALCAVICVLFLHGAAAGFWTAGGFLLAAGCAFAVFWMEDHTDYEWIKNENAEADGFAIKEE